MNKKSEGIRRVVTGHSESGKAIVISDLKVDPLKLDMLPGREFTTLWAADKAAQHPDNGTMQNGLEWFPPPSGYRFFHWVVPAKGTEPPKQKTPEEGLKEVNENLPGFMQYFEPDNPGMHTSHTVDFLYLISGEITLELDDGIEIDFKAGDTIVQNGTRHRWHNKGDIPAVFIVSSVGANRSK